MGNDAMKDRMDFRWADVEPICVIRMVLRNVWMILAAVLIAVLGVRLAVDWLWTPQYSSTITYAVLSRSASASVRTNYTAANEVAAKFSSMLESELMCDVICEAMCCTTMPGTITASVVGETNMLQVTATCSSPKMAFEMVRTVDAHYSDLGAHIDQNAILHVLTNPQAPTGPSNSVNTRRMMMLAGMAAGAAMTAILVWFSISRDTIQNRAAARHKLDAKILASVPREKGGKRKQGKLISETNTSFYFRESFFQLQTAVEHGLSVRGDQPGGKVLLVTSVTVGEGKSTVAANLALALAKKYRAVMLIDADLRNPTQFRLFGRKATGPNGLAGLLRSSQLTAERVSNEIIYHKDTNLVTLFNEHPVRSATELLASENMAKLIAMVRRTVDYVIIDSPPVGMFADGDVLADLVDGSVLVVQQDTVPACDINDAIDAMDQGKAEFLGCVLNQVRTTPLLNRITGSYGYGYGWYGYGYGEKSKLGNSR